MQIHFRRTQDGSRWACTEGLRVLGQQEIAVMVPWPEDDARDMLITDLLRFLESYLRSQPKRILSGQTLRYGWTMLRFMRDEHNLSEAGTDTLLIEEMEKPFSHDNPSYVPGVSRTMTLLQLQHGAIQRNRVAGDAVYPSASQRVIVCTRITPETVQHLRPLTAHRVWQPTSTESGWFVSCCDREHDHDNPRELGAVHLIHLVERLPSLFPYLAMPVDTALLFQEKQAVIFRPGEQGGQVDPEGLLTSLP